MDYAPGVWATGYESWRLKADAGTQIRGGLVDIQNEDRPSKTPKKKIIDSIT